MADNFDRRITPARPDVAAAHLKGQVEAARFVEGEVRQVDQGRTAVWSSPDFPKSRETELLFGERFTVYDRVRGWSWGQSALDGYVGWVNDDDLNAEFCSADYRVTTVMTPLLTKPDLKTPLWDMLPLNAQVTIVSRENGYACIAPNLYVYEKHLARADLVAGDWVDVAERFLGVPYVWGGKTFAGADCSGLIQTALAATGIAAPRDTDMQEKALGRDVSGEARQRGDLVFWKGHVGVMLDSARLLHANAFAMQVAIEPLAEAVARNESPVTSIKRL